MHIKMTLGVPHHVAIVHQMLSESEVEILHQNYNGNMAVHTKQIDVSWLISGVLTAWRAVPSDGVPPHAQSSVDPVAASRALQSDLQRVERVYHRERAAALTSPSLEVGFPFLLASLRVRGALLLEPVKTTAPRPAL